MTAVLLTPPYLQFFDSNGAPLANGKVYTYSATGGTFATLKATYTTQAGDVEAPNPVILDAAGRPETGNGSIWLSGTYDIKVTTSADVLVKSTLNVTSFEALPDANEAYFQTFSGDGTTTVFTTSQDLGTEEKAIYVWVDSSVADEVGYEIQNPSTFTISGTSLTFATAPASGTNNIYVSAPSLLIGSASAAASNAATSATEAAASAAAAVVSETAAAASAAKLKGSSATSVAIATGSKAFTTQADKFFDVGNFLLIASDADESNYMHGQVTAYSSTSLTVNVTNVGGSGTFTDWVITVSGTRGAQGAAGTVGDLSGVVSGTIANDDRLIFQDISDSNTTKATTLSSIRNMVLLREETASTSSTISFDSTYITSTYKTYIIDITSLVPSVDGATGWIRFSQSGSFLSGASNYKTSYLLGAGGSPGGGSVTNTYIPMVAGGGAFGNGTGETANTRLILSDPTQTGARKGISGQINYIDTVGTQGAFIISGRLILNTDPIDGIQFLMDSGSITSGTFKLYGVS